MLINSLRERIYKFVIEQIEFLFHKLNCKSSWVEGKSHKQVAVFLVIFHVAKTPSA